MSGMLFANFNQDYSRRRARHRRDALLHVPHCARRRTLLLLPCLRLPSSHSSAASTGGGSGTSPRKLQIVNTKRQSMICELLFSSSILAARAPRPTVQVVAPRGRCGRSPRREGAVSLAQRRDDMARRDACGSHGRGIACRRRSCFCPRASTAHLPERPVLLDRRRGEVQAMGVVVIVLPRAWGPAEQAAPPSFSGRQDASALARLARRLRCPGVRRGRGRLLSFRSGARARTVRSADWGSEADGTAAGPALLVMWRTPSSTTRRCLSLFPFSLLLTHEGR
ncbi:hypothetical protein FB451DRAFT_1567306 [Mycena latifolia]|nr:hypothetical protein FB451DRAFT_1567306 [Mycena latifolia]